MQQAVRELLGLGRLPDPRGATAPVIEAFDKLLSNVQTPVTDDEACALLQLFGDGDCFGLAWTVLHLIETAPGWPVREALDGLKGEWITRLRERAE